MFQMQVVLDCPFHNEDNGFSALLLSPRHWKTLFWDATHFSSRFPERQKYPLRLTILLQNADGATYKTLSAVSELGYYAFYLGQYRT